MSNKAPSIEKTTYDLGIVLMANLPTCGLPLKVQEYYLTNRNQIPEALRRGFVLPGQEESSAPIIAPSRLYPVADTDLDVMLGKAEEYAKARFGAKVNLREMFAIPATLPWKNVIPVFDPGKLDNRAMVKAMQKQGLKVWEETDVMKYSGSEASEGPTLHLIENSLKPTPDTMGLSPNQLWKTGKTFLRLRGYALAFGLRHFVSKDFLDAETFTWFPDDRLSGGCVADGYGSLGSRGVGFYWDSPDCGNSYGGGRVAIPIPLKS